MSLRSTPTQPPRLPLSGHLLCFSPFSHPPSLLKSSSLCLPISPPTSFLGFKIPVFAACCHTLITIYFPLRAITLRGPITPPPQFSFCILELLNQTYVRVGNYAERGLCWESHNGEQTDVQTRRSK